MNHEQNAMNRTNVDVSMSTRIDNYIKSMLYMNTQNEVKFGANGTIVKFVEYPSYEGGGIPTLFCEEYGSDRNDEGIRVNATLQSYTNHVASYIFTTL